MSRTRWIQCSGCRKLILESEYAAHTGEGEKGSSANVLSDITPLIKNIRLLILMTGVIKAT